MIVLPDVLLSRRGSRGMTLLEIMLAMLVLAVVVAMVSLSLSGSIRVMDATRDQGELYDQARVALQRISEDLASAVLTNAAPFQGTSGDLEGQGGEILRFASHAHVVFDPEHDHPGLSLITYRLRSDDQGEKGLDFIRTDRLLTPSDSEDEEGNAGYGFILCDRLRSVRLSFMDENGDQFEAWDTRPENPDETTPPRLPVSVSCTLVFELDREQDTTLTFSTSVLLPVGLIQVDKSAETGEP